MSEQSFALTSGEHGVTGTLYFKVLDTTTIKVSASTISYKPTVQVKNTAIKCRYGGVELGRNGYADFLDWDGTSPVIAKGSYWTVSQPGSISIPTSQVFNASNKTSKTAVYRSAITNLYCYFYDSSDPSWGVYFDKTGSYNLINQTFELDVPPTATVSAVSFDTPRAYVGLTTASVTVADATAYYGGDIDSVTLTIGEQSVSISGNGTLSILLNAGGTFTPVVTVTDSRGQIQEYQLDPITVGIYSTPTVNFDAQRTDVNGKIADEGEYATIVTTLTFDPIAEAVAPTVAVADEDGIAQTIDSITWYSTRASDGTLSGAVTWSTLPSGSTVYGLISITGDFDTQKSYVISLTPQDSEGITGDPKTDTLQTAFYTVDFLAGGHGIAFGQPASQEGFYCNMDANFMEDVLIDLPDYQTTGTTDKAIYDAVVALGWDSDVIV